MEILCGGDESKALRGLVNKTSVVFGDVTVWHQTLVSLYIIGGEKDVGGHSRGGCEEEVVAVLKIVAEVVGVLLIN